MKQPWFAMLLAGMAMLVLGGVLTLAGGPPKASAALAQKCRDRVSYDPSMQKKCGEAAFATAMTAADNDTSARAISSANASEIGGGMLAKLLFGFGAVSVGSGLLILRNSRRRPVDEEPDAAPL